MRLVFINQHLSITSFDPIELSDFTLITGVNGSGKSHLLDAIVTGSATTGVPREQIARYDWTTLVPNETDQSRSSVDDDREDLWRGYTKAQATFAPRAEKILASGVPEGHLENELDNNFYANISDRAFSKKIIDAARAAGKNFRKLERDDFTLYFLKRASSTMFEQSFAQMFTAYRRVYQENKLRLIEGIEGEPGLSPEEFRGRYKEEPWLFVNEIFKQAGLDFHMKTPSLSHLGPFAPELISSRTGAHVSFRELSSGEKVLMSFALATYNASYDHNVANQPALLLFDEIDAPLHPAMTRSVLKVMQNLLIGKYGIKIIATTHSPSTIALAPENTSIMLMQPGVPGLQEVTKAEALDALTVGIPTVALNFEGRRQVFVESHADAAVYTLLYDRVRPLLPSGRSLQFISCEARNGCAEVLRLVQLLVDAGNHSIFGLIDADNGRNKATSRIKLVAAGRRDGIENVLLDPLLLAGMLIHSFPDCKRILGLADGFSSSQFFRSTTEQLQAIVDSVSLCVFGEGHKGERVPVDYRGGFSLLHDERCMTTDDHAYEAKILKAFPALHGVSQRAGTLLKKVVETIVNENPDFIPADLIETFSDLLDAPAHQIND